MFASIRIASKSRRHAQLLKTIIFIPVQQKSAVGFRCSRKTHAVSREDTWVAVTAGL